MKQVQEGISWEWLYVINWSWWQSMRRVCAIY